MADFPQLTDYSAPVITPASPQSLGVQLLSSTASGGAGPPSSWPTANKAFFVPFRIAYTTTIVKVFWLNSSTVGTNHVDIGIYTQDGVRLVSLGSTLTSGSLLTQVGDITDVTLTAGLYYMAMAVDGTTDTFNYMSGNIPAPQPRTMGVLEQTSAFPLPNPATMVGSTASMVPLLGLTQQTVV